MHTLSYFLPREQPAIIGLNECTAMQMYITRLFTGTRLFNAVAAPSWLHLGWGGFLLFVVNPGRNGSFYIERLRV